MLKALTLEEAVSQGIGVERACLCPVHPDTRPSASVNVLKGVWFCYTCKAHGVVGGEAMAGAPDFGLVREFIDDQMAEARFYPEGWLNQFDAAGAGAYWWQRFSKEACEHFRLGVDYEGRPVYPLRDHNGQVMGVVTRSNYDRGPKYLYPKGIDIGQYLFNFSWDLRKTLILVEGAADAIAVWEAGYEAFALYGSRLSDRQRDLIKCVEPEKIITAFDQDKAGHQAAQQVAKAFPEAIIGTWYPELGDIADMDVSLRKKILQRLVFAPVHNIGSTPCSSTILSPALRPPSLP